MEDYFDETMENEEDAMEEDEERGHLLRRTFQPYGIAGLRTYGAGLRTYGAGLHRGLSYGLNYRPAVYGHNLGWRSSVYSMALPMESGQLSMGLPSGLLSMVLPLALLSGQLSMVLDMGSGGPLPMALD